MNQALPHSAHRKLELMFRGLRYSEALGAAATHAFPNFHPYRFAPGEHDPTGEGKATSPYLMRFDDGSVVRVRGDATSPWAVAGDPGAGTSAQRILLEAGFETQGGSGNGITGHDETTELITTTWSSPPGAPTSPPPRS